MNGKNRKTLLLVEDEVLISMTEKKQLEKYGYGVLTATTGEKAVDAFRNGHAIDLVLMDINLGNGIDGTEAARLILQDRDVPIVFVSSHTEPEIVEKTEKITSYGYVVKSSSITVLDASIKMAFKLFDANRTVTASESQYHALVDGMPGIVYSFSNKRGGLFYSSSAREILGYAPEQLLADPLLWQNSIHEDDLPRIKEVISNSKRGVPFQIDYRIHDARGEWHWFEDRSFGARDSGDEVIIDGLAMDITSLKRAEEEVHGNDVRLRKLFTNVPDLVFQFTRRPDGSYHVPIASQGIKNIFGCSPEDVIEDFEPIGRVIHPEDAARVIADIEYSAEHLSYFTCEFRVNIPGKGIQWIYSRSSPERLADGSVTWYGFNADITGRRLAERTLAEKEGEIRLLLDSTAEAIYGLDMDGNCTFCNPACLRMLGYKDPGEILGKNMHWQIHSKRPDGTHFPVEECRIVNAFQKGERTHVDDEVLWKADGTSFPAEYWSYPQVMDGKVVGAVVTFLDITDRMNTAMTLKDNREKLELALKSANMGVWQFFIEQDRRVFDTQVCRLLGITASQFGGTAEEFFSRLHPDDRDQVRSALKATIERDLPYRVEYRVLWDDGSIHHIAARGKLVRVRNHPSSIIGTLWDISDFKRSEATLREGEEKYRVIFNNEIYAICIFDLETLELLDANEAYQRLYGYSREELVSGLTIHDITAEHPASAAATVQAKQGGTIYIPLRYHRKKDGTVFPVEIVGGPYEWKGRKVMFALARDISDRKHALDALHENERRFRALFEQAAVGVAQIETSTGQFTTINRKYCDIVGYSQEELRSRSFKDLTHPVDLPADLEYMARLCRNEIREFTIEKRYVHKNGSLVWVNLTVSPLWQPGEEQEFHMAIVEDITERKRAGNELHNALRENRRLLDELQHRAKNSFNMIGSMIGMASSDGASPETRKALDYLETRVRSVSVLYDLLYAKGSVTGVRLDDYCVRVAGPMIALAGNISLRAEMESLTVSVKAAAPIGLILTELVTNAVKYAFPGGRKGTITVELRKVPDGTALLAVGDDGVGLPDGFELSSNAGMGLNLIRGLAGQVDGVFRMGNGITGTRCTLEFGLGLKQSGDGDASA